MNIDVKILKRAKHAILYWCVVEEGLFLFHGYFHTFKIKLDGTLEESYSSAVQSWQTHRSIRATFF